MALNFELLGDAGAPVTNYLQGQQDVVRNQLAQQQFETGRIGQETSRLTQDKMRMEMDAFKRRQAGLDQFMQKAKELGVDGDPEQLTKVFYDHALSTGDPQQVQAATIAVQTARERKAYIASQSGAGGAVATPVSMTNNLGTPLPPAGAPPMPFSAGAAPPQGNPLGNNRLSQIENRLIELRQFPNAGKQEREELVKERDRLMTPHIVGTNLVTLGGGVAYTAPEKIAPIAESPLAKLQREMAALPPNDPRRTEYAAMIRKETTNPPGTNVNVNTFTPASVEAQKQFVQTATDERKVLRNAPDTLKNLEAAKKLIPTASTFMGKGGEPLLAAASFLNNRLGFGISTQGVTDATVLRTRLFEGILDNLKKLDSQPSQEQQRVLAEALGNLGTDPAALEQILNRIGETVRDRVDRFNTDVTEAETRGVKFPFKPQITLPSFTPPPPSGASLIPGSTPAAGAFKYLGKESSK